MIPILLQLNNLLSSILPGFRSWRGGIHHAKLYPTEYHSIQWYESWKNPQKKLQFLCPWILPPIYTPIHFGRQAVEESLKQGIKGNEVLLDRILGTNMVEICRFRQTRLVGEKNTSQSFFGVFFLLKRFFVNVAVLLHNNCLQKNNYDIHGCTLLKALLHRLHGRGKAALFLFGCVSLVRKDLRILLAKKPGKHQLIQSQLDYGSYPKFGLLGGKTSSIPNQW